MNSITKEQYRKEIVKIMRLLVGAFPNFRPLNMTDTIDTWAKLLWGYDIRAVELAVKRYILTDTSGFAPSIGQVVELIQDMRDGVGLTELEAWAMVSRAIGNANYYAQEEFDALPETVRKAVGSADNLREWAVMDIKTVQSVVQSHFVRNFRTVHMREREDAKLLPEFRAILKDMHEGEAMLPRKEFEKGATE